MKRTVGISEFVKRQTKHSEFTHWDGTWDQLGLLASELLEDNERWKHQFDEPMVEDGYRDGVMLIHIPGNMCHGFFTYTDFPMFEGMKLRAKKFDFEPEITAKILKRRYKIKEIPISYDCRSFSEGKKINWKDGIKATYYLIRYRFLN